jgi:hypothetical protein
LKIANRRRLTWNNGRSWSELSSAASNAAQMSRRRDSTRSSASTSSTFGIEPSLYYRSERAPSSASS